MKSRLWVAAFVALALTLGGCSSNKIKDDKDAASNSLVFGYVDMKDAPTDLDWVSLRQVLPKTDKPYWHQNTDDGKFWNSRIKPGAYQFDSFGGHSGWRNMDFTFELPRQYADKLRVKIDKPGIYYLGSYKYVKIKTGFFEPDKFDFVPVTSPSEREILEKLLDDYTTGPDWQARIRKHLAELPK